MSDLVYRAMMFAMDKHKNQKRKYTNEPYFLHLAEVAGIVASVVWSEASYTAERMIASAYLHDVVEDQNVHDEVLRKEFGWMVARNVLDLSDLEEGNRETRKKLSRDRLSFCSHEVQTIKCADLISNTSSIVEHDPKFAKVYLAEKRALLKVLTKADRRLWDIAVQQCEDFDYAE